MREELFKLPEDIEKKILIYTSSQLGFAEAGRFYMRQKYLPDIQKIDPAIFILNPWDLTSDSEVEAIKKIPDHELALQEWKKFNRRVYLRNVRAIELCDIFVCDLDGVDVDPGVSWEVGYRMGLDRANGENTPILAYRSDFRSAGENPGTKINLQVGEAIEINSPIVKHLDQLIELIAQEVAKIKQMKGI
jgi:nucleoside 2-deoxyribosyltransferase